MKQIQAKLNVDADRLRDLAKALEGQFDRLIREYMPKCCSVYANTAYSHTPPFGNKIPAKYDYSQAVALIPGTYLKPEEWRQFRLAKKAGKDMLAVKVKKRPKTTKGQDYYLAVRGNLAAVTKNTAVKQAAWIRTRGKAKLGWLRGLAGIGGTPMSQAQTLIRKRPDAWNYASGDWRLEFSPGKAEATVTYGIPAYLNESVVRYAMDKAQAAAQRSLDNFVSNQMEARLK